MKVFQRVRTSNRILIVCFIVNILTFILYYKRLLPMIFNNLTGIDDDKHLNIYFTVFFIVSLILNSIFIKFAFYRIDSLDELSDEKKFILRDRYLYLPFLIYLLQIGIVIIVFICAGVLITINDSFSKAFKLFIACVTFETINAVILLILSRQIIRGFLLSLSIREYKSINKPFLKLNLNAKILIQIIPIFFASLLLTMSIAYDKMLNDKGEFFSEFARYQLNNSFSSNKIIDISEATRLLKNIKIKNLNICYFIINPSGKLEISSGNISNESIKYINKNNNGYIFYGKVIEEQGVFKKIKTTSGEFIVGVKYDVTKFNTISYFTIGFLMLFIFNVGIVIYFSNSISFDIKTIIHSMDNLASGKNDFEKYLPITSNDEIGDLVIAFNSIQELEKKHIVDLENSYQEVNSLNEEVIAMNEELMETLEKLQKTQGQLIESEKLIFLGNIMSGIAHNLKTPLTSCAGALMIIDQKISSIVDELDKEDNSISESIEVINKWKDKIEYYIHYMSKVINTVQSYVAPTKDADFSIDELINSIRILMDSTLKKNKCTLKTTIYIKDDTARYKGDVNILIQVINNLIENAIQEYNGTSGLIELEFHEKDKNIIITVRDYGKGIKQNVRDVLFKQFVTTKGKGGKGLGLYISKLIIVSKFNGEISFDTSDNGTIFYIKIPLSSMI